MSGFCTLILTVPWPAAKLIGNREMCCTQRQVMYSCWLKTLCHTSGTYFIKFSWIRSSRSIQTQSLINFVSRLFSDIPSGVCVESLVSDRVYKRFRFNYISINFCDNVFFNTQTLMENSNWNSTWYDFLRISIPNSRLSVLYLLITFFTNCLMVAAFLI